MMAFTDTFEIARLPRILFGAGRIAELVSQIKIYGNKALIVTGAKSFQATAHWQTLQQDLQTHRIHWELITVSGEPSPRLVDQVVQNYRNQEIEVVVGIGGGCGDWRR